MAKKPEYREKSDQRSKAETEKVRDEALKNMLKSPPRPHKDEPKRGNKSQKSKDS